MLHKIINKLKPPNHRIVFNLQSITIKRTGFLFVLLFGFYSIYGQADQVYKKISPIVVTLISYDNTGQVIGQASGVILNSKGDIITNLHIFETGERTLEKIEVKHAGDLYSVIGAYGYDVDNDLLLLKSNAEIENEIKIADSDNLEIGQKVFAIGSPAGFENTISEGIISGVRINQNIKRIQITASISQGSSGGAAVNSKGELIGICNMVVSNAQNINFAIASNDVQKLILKCKNIVPQKYSLFVVLGDYFLLSKLYEKSRAFYYKAQLLQSNSNILYKIAKTYFEESSFFNAVKYCNKALALDNANLDAKILLGGSMIKLNKMDSAKLLLQQIVLNFPDAGLAWYYLAKMAFTQGDFDSCVKYATQAYKYLPSDFETLKLLCSACVLNNNYEQAINYCQQAIAINRNSFEVYESLSRAHYELKHYNDALDAGNQAINANPRSGDANLYVAMAHNKLGNYKNAKYYGEQAIYCDPENISAYLITSAILFNMANYYRAIEVAKQCIQMDSTCSTCYKTVFSSFLKLDQKDSATVYLKLDIKHENEKSNYYANLAKLKRKNYDAMPYYSCIIGNMTYKKCQHIITFEGKPLLTFQGWKDGVPLHFDLDIYVPQAGRVCAIVNGKIAVGNLDYVQLVTSENEVIVIEKKSQVVLFHALREINNPNVPIKIWLNLYLPNGNLFQANPEQTNQSGNNMMGEGNTVSGTFSCFSF